MFHWLSDRKSAREYEQGYSDGMEACRYDRNRHACLHGEKLVKYAEAQTPRKGFAWVNGYIHGYDKQLSMLA